MRAGLSIVLSVALSAPGALRAQERVERTTGSVRVTGGAIETIATDYGCVEIKLPLEGVQFTLRAEPAASVDWILAARALIARRVQPDKGERRSIAGPELLDAAGSTMRLFREAEHAASHYTVLVVSRTAGHPEIGPLISSVRDLGEAQLSASLANLQKAIGWTKRYSSGRRCPNLSEP